MASTTPFGPQSFGYAWLTEVTGFSESSTIWFSRESTFRSDTLPMLSIWVDRLSGQRQSPYAAVAAVASCAGKIEVPAEVSFVDARDSGGAFAGSFRIDTPAVVAEGNFALTTACLVSTDK